MPISQIRIVDYRGREKALINAETAAAIAAGDGAWLHLDVPGCNAGMDVTPHRELSLLAQAADSLLENPYMTALAGTGPDPDGNLDITGDLCLSWKVVPGAEARDQVRYRTVCPGVRTVAYLDRAGIDEGRLDRIMDTRSERPVTDSYQSGLEYSEVFSAGRAGSLELTDMCPSCRSCSEAFSLLKRLEWCKLALNALKDASLYDESVYRSRMDYLSSRRMPVPAGCADSLSDDIFSRDPDIVTTELMMQYAAMVHMWNYAVTQNNSSTIIQTAPEDSAGFFVHTKRALPSCHGKATLNCEVLVEPGGSSKPAAGQAPSMQEGLSMFVVKPVVDFMPFGTAALPEPTVYPMGSPTSKRVITSFPPAEAAGTYSLLVKFLPFKYVRMLDHNNNELNVQEYLSRVDWDDIPTTPYEETEERSAGESIELDATGELQVLDEPDQKAYNDSKTYPSYSVPGRNRWKITVTWTVVFGTGLDKSWKETYYYETNKVREELKNILRQSDLDEILGDEETPAAPPDPNHGGQQTA